MFKKISVYLFICLALILIGIYVIGSYLTNPYNTTIGSPPTELQAEAVLINKISGWFHQSASNKCVLLLHGVRSNKLSMVNRAVFLNRLGYSTLLIDLQAHGETPGKRITLGYKESDDVKAAIDYLKNIKKCSKIGAIGTSLGGAAILLGDKPAELDAAILEAVYPSIEQAVTNRIEKQLGLTIAKLTSSFLYYQIPLRLKIPLDNLKPDKAIGNIKAPVLIIGGSEDRHTKIEETQKLYSFAPEPKQLWIIKGAAHVNFHDFAKSEYEKIVSEFFSLYL